MSDEPKCKSCGTPWSDHPGAIKMCDELTRLRAENERLAGIVGRLPKTADGVPTTPGMKCYQPTKSGRIAVWESMGIASWRDEGNSGAGPLNSWSQCYSTREAAEAARGKA